MVILGVTPVERGYGAGGSNAGQQAVVVGDNGRILYTSDGGNTWEIPDRVSPEHLVAVQPNALDAPNPKPEPEPNPNPNPNQVAVQFNALDDPNPNPNPNPNPKPKPNPNPNQVAVQFNAFDDYYYASGGSDLAL